MNRKEPILFDLKELDGAARRERLAMRMLNVDAREMIADKMPNGRGRRLDPGRIRTLDLFGYRKPLIF